MVWRWGQDCRDKGGAGRDEEGRAEASEPTEFHKQNYANYRGEAPMGEAKKEGNFSSDQVGSRNQSCSLYLVNVPRFPPSRCLPERVQAC